MRPGHAVCLKFCIAMVCSQNCHCHKEQSLQSINVWRTIFLWQSTEDSFSLRVCQPIFDACIRGFSEDSLVCRMSRLSTRISKPTDWSKKDPENVWSVQIWLSSESLLLVPDWLMITCLNSHDKADNGVNWTLLNECTISIPGKTLAELIRKY